MPVEYWQNYKINWKKLIVGIACKNDYPIQRNTDTMVYISSEEDNQIEFDIMHFNPKLTTFQVNLTIFQIKFRISQMN